MLQLVDEVRKHPVRRRWEQIATNIEFSSLSADDALLVFNVQRQPSQQLLAIAALPFSVCSLELYPPFP